LLLVPKKEIAAATKHRGVGSRSSSRGEDRRPNKNSEHI
jgi:hypothetical protein